MVTSEEIHSLLARKQAGVCRMQERQRHVHLKMAQMLEEHPEMIEHAKKKVQHRLEISGIATKEIYLEWNEILTTWSVKKIAEMLRDEDTKREQLRACAPFDFVNV
jgi:hypothetical protein